jgi:hypothetical protein
MKNMERRYIDDWFAGIRAKGNEVVAAINKYKADMKSVLGTDVKYAYC